MWMHFNLECSFSLFMTVIVTYDMLYFRSEFFTIHRETERRQNMITQDRREHVICTGDKLAKMSGLELCGEVSFTNASLIENAPYFPMTGPINAGITLYKRDTSMTGYKIEARSTHVSFQYGL